MMAGTTKGPLDGIPIGHKDIYNTAGIRTTGAFEAAGAQRPDTGCDRRCANGPRRASVLMGKLSTHEFAMGGPSFDLPWPPARNPWNPEHFTAGSSSGTGAAVASGMILGGTGSDTGGSIRGPAALCGIAGIKPTYGLGSRAGVLPLSFTHGPRRARWPGRWRTARCCCRRWPATIPRIRPAPIVRCADFTADIGKGVKGLRIGVVRHFFETDNPVSPATLQGINHALDVFEHLGAEISEVKLSPMDDYHACGSIILTSEAYAVHEPWLKTRFNDYGELFRDRLALGGFIRATDYVQAMRRRRALCQELKAAMADLRHPGVGLAGRRGAEDHRGAEMGHDGEAVVDDAIQPDRLSGDERVQRLRRGRAAGVHAVDRQAVHGGDAVPGGACVRDGGWHAQASAHDGDGRGGGLAAVV